MANKKRRVTKPVEKSPSKLNPLARPISFHKLPGAGKALGGTLAGLQKNADKINAMKKRGDKFAFQVNGIRSYQIYSHIEDLIQDLQDSEGIQEVLRKRQKSKELYDSIKLVRWNRSRHAWKPKAQKLPKVKSHALKQARNRKRKKK